MNRLHKEGRRWMPDEISTSDDVNLTICAIPAHLADAAAEILDRSGVAYKKWSCVATANGKAPMSIEDAIEDLKKFDEMGIYGLAPEVIASNTTKEQITTLCQQIAESEWYAWKEVKAISAVNGEPPTLEWQQQVVDRMCTSKGRMPDYMYDEAIRTRTALMAQAAAKRETVQ